MEVAAVLVVVEAGAAPAADDVTGAGAAMVRPRRSEGCWARRAAVAVLVVAAEDNMSVAVGSVLGVQGECARA